MSVIAPILMLVTLIAWRVQPHPPPRGTPPSANGRWKPVVVAGVGCGVLAMLSVPAAVLAVMNWSRVDRYSLQRSLKAKSISQR